MLFIVLCLTAFTVYSATKWTDYAGDIKVNLHIYDGSIPEYTGKMTVLIKLDNGVLGKHCIQISLPDIEPTINAAPKDAEGWVSVTDLIAGKVFPDAEVVPLCFPDLLPPQSPVINTAN